MNRYPRRLAAVGAAVALGTGGSAFLFANFAGPREREPHLYALAVSFVACAFVVVVRAHLEARLNAEGIEPPPSERSIRFTTLAAVLACTALILVPLAVAKLELPIESVFFALDAVPWGRMLVVWFVALSVVVPAARWCTRAARLLERGPRRF